MDDRLSPEHGISGISIEIHEARSHVSMLVACELVLSIARFRSIYKLSRSDCQFRFH